MQVFGTLRLLTGFLGPSRPLLGRSGPKWVPKTTPKVFQKVSKNWSKKMTSKMHRNWSILGPKIDPKMGQDGEPGAQANQDGGV